MSRVGDYGDEAEYNNAGDLWAHNVEQALSGKRGKQALADLKAALEALPEKRLIMDALCTVGIKPTTEPPKGWWDPARNYQDLLERQGRGVCAVGAYVWWRKVKGGMDPQEAFESLPVLQSEDHDIWDTGQEGEKAGLAGVLAWELAYMNDETYGHLTPEDRYAKFMAWIDEQLAKPPRVWQRKPKPEKPRRERKFAQPSPFEQQVLA